MVNMKRANHSIKAVLRKVTALAIAGVFLSNTLLSGLSFAEPFPGQKSTLRPWTVMEQPGRKREITAHMYRESRLIWIANSQRYLDLLARYNALALLLPSGRYLMAPETAANDLSLIRGCTHEDVEILMQQEEKLHSTRYGRLKKQLLNNEEIMALYRKLSGYKNITAEPDNIIFNDLIAKAFELLFIIDEYLVYPNTELTKEEKEFARLMRPILEAKDTWGRYKNFSQVFFDVDRRTKAIQALQEDKSERFYRVASTETGAVLTPKVLGESVGVLRLIPDIVTNYRALREIKDNEIAAVDFYPAADPTFSRPMAIITGEEVAGLSRAEVRARYWRIPHAVIQDLSRLKNFDGKWVYIKVTEQGVELRLATEDEIANYASYKPKAPTPKLEEKDIYSPSTSLLSEAELTELRRLVNEKPVTITIDGEASTGKTTLARGLAERLGIGFFSYGKIFRLAMWYIKEKNMHSIVRASMTHEEIAELTKILKKIKPEKFEYRKQDGEERYYYDGRDITDELNDSDIINNAPFISRTPELRNIIVGYAVALIEQINKDYKGVVLEGRVTGTELAPVAELKIFLKTNLAVRASRRARELAGDNWKEILEKTIQELRARDRIDENREIMPSAPASDAYTIDTTLLTKEEALNNALIKLFETLKRTLPETRAGPSQETKTTVDFVGFISPAQPYLSTTHALYTLSGNLKAHFKDDVKVSIHDMYANHSISIDSIVDAIIRNKPRVLGLSIVAGTLNSAKELFDKIKEKIPENQRPLIVLGNSVPNYIPEILLKEYFPGALIIQGEGELPLIELVEHVKGQRKLEDVHNLFYLDQGRIITTPKIEADLGKLISPDMNEIAALAKQGVEVYIESSRGCPWGKCLFCASRDLLGSRKQARRWRPRNTEQVLKEIKTLVDNGIEHFNFADEEFVGPGRDGVKKAQDIANGIIDICRKSGKKVSFTFACRADSIWEDDDKGNDADLRGERVKAFRLLKEAGLRNVFVGVESGSQSQLDRYNKGLTIAESENAIKILRELGIGFEIGFIMFDPEVILKEIEENLDFLARNDLLMNTSWFLNTLRLSAGTPFANSYKRKPEFNVPKNPDYNTLQYSYSFKEKSAERLEKLVHDFFRDIHRLYYFLKYIRRSGLGDEEFATYDKYRKLLLQWNVQYFRGFLKIEQDSSIPEEKKIFELYNTSNSLLPEQIKFAEDLIREVRATGKTERAIAKEVIRLASAFIEKANARKADEKIVDSILKTGIAGSVEEIIRPQAPEGDTTDLNETIFIIKPGGTFNKVLMRDILGRIRNSGYVVSGVKVLSGEEIRRENLFEKVYEVPFSIARKGEGLFTKDDYERIGKIYNRPKCEGYFGISFDEVKIIPAYDLTEKYGLSEKDVIDLWTAAYKEEIFMNGDYRGINKIGPSKYVLMTRHPRVENGKPFLLVNGLLIQMKSLSEATGEKTIVFLLKGAKGKSDTWKEMREKFMGDRSPLYSPIGSIRYDAFKRILAVTEDVPFWKNIAHMSSGPLEALREELLWFNLPVEQTAFGKALLANGYTIEEINYFIGNPDLEISGVKKPLFDWVEKMDSFEAILFIGKVFPPFYDDKAIPTMTFEEYMKYKNLHDRDAINISTNIVDGKRISRTSTKVQECPKLGTPESRNYASAGSSLIQHGKLAQVLLSGGTAGRFFGYDVPERLRVKFLADSYEFDGRTRTFAELKIANNLWAARQANGKIPIWIMTSALNDDVIKEFLQVHHYFGFSTLDIHFYIEGDVPRMNPTRQDLKTAFPDKSEEWINERIIENGGEGGIFRFVDGGISRKPVGHLDAITSLFMSKELLAMLDEGVEYISFSDATNLGTNIDPAILGMFARSDKDVLHILANKNMICDIEINNTKYIALLRNGVLVYSSLPSNLTPFIEDGKITHIVDSITNGKVEARITGRLEKGGTLVDIDGKPQIVEGFRFPNNYDQGAIPYFSTVHQLVRANAILRLFGIDIDTYRKASKEQLLKLVSDFNARLNTYIEIKKVIDDDLGRNRIAVQFSRLSGDLTSLLPTEYVLIDRDGKETQCAFIPAKEKEDLEINKMAVLNALTGRLILQDVTSQLPVSSHATSPADAGAVKQAFDTLNSEASVMRQL